MQNKIKLALEKLVKENTRFSLKIVKEGFYLNKKDGNYGFISNSLEYKQPKGCSWRNEINSYLKEFNLELKNH